MKTGKRALALCIAVCSGPAAAQFVPSAESIEGLYPGKVYSPYAQRAFPSRVFWGDTHLHTGYSMDAGLSATAPGMTPRTNSPAGKR